MTSLLINILFHILFLYTILFLFFFNIAHNIEKNIFKQLLSNNIEYYFNKLKEKIKFNDKKKLNNKILNIALSSNNNILDKIHFKESNNKQIYNNAKTLLIILIILVIVIIVYLYLYKNVSKNTILNILLENIAIFTIICCVEVLFFYNIILEYSPIKISYFLDAIKKILL